jgi:hypothetical protein
MFSAHSSRAAIPCFAPVASRPAPTDNAIAALGWDPVTAALDCQRAEHEW